MALVILANCHFASYSASPLPGNDDFENAVRLPTLGGNIVGTAVNATREAGEPFNPNGVNSVWYSWNPAASGYFRLVHQSLVSVWIFRAGNSATVTDLILTGQDGEKPWLEAGVNYFIGVYGKVGLEPFASFDLTVDTVVSRPSNDDVTNAIELFEDAAHGVNVTGSAFGATYEQREMLNTNGIASVWYKWTPGISGRPRFSGAGSLPFIWFYAAVEGNSQNGLLNIAREGATPLLSAGITYYIAVFGGAGGIGPFEFRMELVPPPAQVKPANDDFANAIELHEENLRVVVNGTTIGSTFERNEPWAGLGSGSVWFKWTASAAPFDSTIDIGGGGGRFFTGTSLDTLRPTYFAEMRGGETYYIQVPGGNGGEPFQFTLLLPPPPQPPPPNDNFEQAKVLEGLSGSMPADTTWATFQQEENSLPLNCIAGGGHTLWYRFTAPRRGLLSGRTVIGTAVHGFVGTSLSTLTALPLVAWRDVGFVVEAGQTCYIRLLTCGGISDTFSYNFVPFASNDAFADAILITGANSQLRPDGDIASNEPGETDPACFVTWGAVWWKYVPPASGVLSPRIGSMSLAVYRGTSLANLELLACDALTSLPVQAGETYYIKTPINGLSDPTLTVSLSERVENDDFENATVLTGTFASVSAQNLNATFQPGEPLVANDAKGKTLWYTWVAPFEGSGWANTVFGGQMRRYRGSTLQTLQEVPAWEFLISPGERYYFQVDSTVSSGESFLVQIGANPADAPPNDSFAQAIEQSGPFLSGWAIVNNATAEAGEPSHLNGPQKTAWWRWSVPEDGPARITLQSPQLLTTSATVAVYTGDTLGSLQLVSKGVDGASWFSTANQLYYVAVAVPPEGKGLVSFGGMSATFLKPPRIDFPQIPDVPVYTGPIELHATDSLGGPVGFYILSGHATISSNLLTVTGPGKIEVGASPLPGGESSIQSFMVYVGPNNVPFVKPPQTIDFSPPNELGTEPLTLSGTSSSGAPLAFSVVSGQARVDGDVLSAVGPGQVVVRATAFGNDYYQPAAVERTLQIAKAGQQIQFAPIADARFGTGPIALQATVSSGLPLLFQIVSGPGSLNGNTVTPTGAGTITVRASQPGTEGYLSATPVERTFTVSRGVQTISFPLVIENGSTTTLNASSSSGLPVVFELASGSGSMTGDILQRLGPGSIVVRASQSGDANWEPATAVLQTFEQPRLVQTIQFTPVQQQVFGTASIALNAIATSGLPVVYSVLEGPGSLSANVLNILGAGFITVTFAQSGNETYEPAPNEAYTITIQPAAQFIQFDPVDASGPTVELHASASSGLPVSFVVLSGSGQIVGNRLENAGEGPITIQARQSGNVNYLAASPVGQTVIVKRITQGIDFQPIENLEPQSALQTSTTGIRSLGTGASDAQLRARATSGLPVGFRVLSGPAVVTGSLLSMTGTGEVVVEAFQNGDSYFAPATARRTITRAAPRISQTIRFDALPDVSVTTGPLELQATASSGLLVRFTLIRGNATLFAALLSIQGAGQITIQASQSGNDQFDAALPVERSFEVTRLPQSITFTDAPPFNIGESPRKLVAIASSGLPVTFQLVSGPARLMGDALTVTSAGRVVVRATQGGNNIYLPASIDREFTVTSKTAQSIQFDALPNISVSTKSIELHATASSGLPVTFTLVSGNAVLSGTTLTIKGAGQVTVHASQPGNDQFDAAPMLEGSFEVTRLPQAINLTGIPSLHFADPPAKLSAIASSGLPVSFQIVFGSAELIGDLLRPISAGSITIRASQSGNDTWLPAPDLETTITIGKASQTISFPPPAERLSYDGRIHLSAGASSGLPIIFRVVSGPGELSDDILYANNEGQIIVEASQGGDANYESTAVQQTITALGSPELSVGLSQDKLLLAWPENSDGFQLESARSLDGPWSTFTLPEPSQSRTEITIDSSFRFFRLKSR